MSLLKSLTIAAGAALALTVPALANVTVVNQTEDTKMVTFDLGNEEIRMEVAAGATVEQPCPEYCGVRFSGHDKMAVDGYELAITEESWRPVLLSK